MNVYQVSNIEFEPIVMLTDHHERAISKFQWALAGGLGFLPPVNFTLSWIDPSTLPLSASLEELVTDGIEGFAECTMGSWQRFDFT
ncbi:hypothetical protein [Qipengyuania soli]|uniref:Uncharacterized protein n=1 Tax=Qipengyuania soli TaxID=2782568 RepID=A0A7S8IVD2_9SPHN|nr:hypothetical protein [Qipengyuania soli]QPC99737.1 hypothetical protein IRL76_04065 [Qipengyuania soli]